MSFKTKNERYAYVRGLKAGAKGKKPFNNAVKKPSKDKAKDKPVKYDYSTYFDFDSKGNIKGSYTADGFFEPD